MKPSDIDLKNMSENYNLNGKELREALGRKPEESLDDYKENLCVPVIVRRDIDEKMTDDEWNSLYDNIINDDGFYNEIDNTLAYYLEKMDKDRELIREKESKERPHTLDVMIESYDNLRLRVSDEDYNRLIEESKSGKILASTMDEIIKKNIDTISDGEVFTSQYIDVTIDGKDTSHENSLAGIEPIDIDDAIDPSSTPDVARWNKIVYKKNKK